MYREPVKLNQWRITNLLITKLSPFEYSEESLIKSYFLTLAFLWELPDWFVDRERNSLLKVVDVSGEGAASPDITLIRDSRSVWVKQGKETHQNTMKPSVTAPTRRHAATPGLWGH